MMKYTYAMSAAHAPAERGGFRAHHRRRHAELHLDVSHAEPELPPTVLPSHWLPKMVRLADLAP